MPSVTPVSFCFHLSLISTAILAALAVPTDHTSCESSKNLCATGPGCHDMRYLENRGFCHYKVCEDKYGYKNGMTRNPDVIYRIVCKETAECKQVYLTVELAFTKDSVTINKTEKVPTGCLYSKTDLRDSNTVENTEPRTPI
jgi:hypothetical protein